MSIVSISRHRRRVRRTPHAMGWWCAQPAMVVAFGDDAVDVRELVPTSSLTGEDAVRYLQRQINRYTLDGGAPVHLRVGAAPVPVTGTLDDTTISRAIWIMQMRAGMAHIQWGDGASKELLAEAMSAYRDPRGFVTKYINKIIDVVRLFADKHGIPPATIGLTPTMITAGVTVAALAIIFMSSRRKR